MLTNSFTDLENIRLQTCDPVSNIPYHLLLNVFQNLIHLSAVPPPLTKNPCLCGDHAKALTAAL